MDSLIGSEAKLEDGYLLVNENTASNLLSNLLYEDYRSGDAYTYKDVVIFPLVGCWGKSNNATATAASLSVDGKEQQLYAYSGKSAATATEDLKKVEFNGESTSYYIRVGKDVEKISLDLTAFEPFLDFQSTYGELGSDSQGVDGQWTYGYKRYNSIDIFGDNAEASPVHISVNGDPVTSGVGCGKFTYSAENDGYYCEKYPTSMPSKITASWESENSAEQPMRSNWSCVDIPIEPATDGNPCNEIVVKITAPSGATKEYTFYVHRAAELSVTLKPGNTPAGMVMRENDKYWDSDEKQKWLQKFVDERKLPVEASLRLHGEVYAENDIEKEYDLNNGGIVYRGKYWLRAWCTDNELLNDSSKDLDQDPGAIVAYMNYEFDTPGFDIVMTNGSLYTGQGGGKLERRIRLDVPKEGISVLDAIAPATNQTETYYETRYYKSTGTDRLYNCGEDDGWEEIKYDSLHIDLRDLKVLPGVYSIEYRFTDPYTGEQLTFRRSMAIITIPGDVDMDGVTTTADASALRFLVSGERIKKDGDYTSDRMALFALRVCNVASTDEDAVDEKDIDALRSGFRPHMAYGGESDFFYFPLASADSRYQRTSAGGIGNASLQLEYSGKQTVVTNDITVDAEDPSQLVLCDQSILTSPKTTSESVALGDVFWVEVKLDELGKYTNVNTFTATLSYDSRYIRPATRKDMEASGYGYFDDTDTEIESTLAADYQSATGASDTAADWANWAVVMYKYNLRPASANATVWSASAGSKSRFTMNFASTSEQNYSTHFSKLKSELEQQFENADNMDDLKEVVFSIRSLSKAEYESERASFGNGGILLRVPFYMHTFPTEVEEKDEKTMPLVSIDLGMQEMVFVNGGDDLLGGSQAGSYETTLDTVAYSAQESIYGGLTKNFREDITCSAEPLEIPIAADTTEYIELPNQANGSGRTEYGEAYSYSSKEIEGVTISLYGLDIYEADRGKLPPGISYDKYNGLSGTPEKAGVYKFRLGDDGSLRVKITVDKAPLTIYPVSGESYYGESDFANDSYTDSIGADGKYEGFDNVLDYRLQYRYDPKDIKQIDLTYNGKGAVALHNLKNPDGSEITVERDNLSGRMDELAVLLGALGRTYTEDKNNLSGLKNVNQPTAFEHPTLSTSVGSTSEGRTARTQVGDYRINIDEDAVESAKRGATVADATLENYYLVIDTSASASLTVLPRPITIARLNFGEVGNNEGYIEKTTIDDTDTAKREDRIATLGGGKSEFDVATKQSEATAADDSNRSLYDDRPLTGMNALLDGDELQIEYQWRFMQKEGVDVTSGSKNFTVAENSVELRDVYIDGVRLIGGSSLANYTLDLENGVQWTVPNEQKVNDGGYVRNLPLQSVSVSNSINNQVKLEYGETIDLGHIDATLAYTYGTRTIQYAGKDKFNEQNLYVSLVRVKGDPSNDEIDGADEEIQKLSEEKETASTIAFGGDPDDRQMNWDNYVAVPSFDSDTVLPAMNGEYCLRIAYMKDGMIYKTAYTEPVYVAKKNITIRMLEERHYYGEKPEFKYVFNIQDLATVDLNSVEATFYDNVESMDIVYDGTTRQIQAGNAAALAEALDYDENWKAPTVVAVDTGGIAPVPVNGGKSMFTDSEANKITEKSPVTNVDFYIGIYGAEHENYNFIYRQIYRGIGSTIPVSEEYGYNYGRVEPRPVVVKALQPNNDDPLDTVYADSTSLTLTGREYAGVTFTIPKNSSTGALEYYEKDSATAQKITLPLTEENVGSDGLVGDDGRYIAVHCDIDLLQDYARWENMNRTFFNMTAGKGGDPYKVIDTESGVSYCHATVKNMQVVVKYSNAEEKAKADQAVKNYKLVYASSTAAAKNIPQEVSLYDKRSATVDGRSGYTYTAITNPNSASEIQYVVGYVKLLIRPIVGITILTSPNNTKYTYGDGFAPVGLSVCLTFDTKYGEMDTSQTATDGMKFTSQNTATLAIGQSGNIFGNYGLEIALARQGGSTSAVEFDQHITPAEHDGSYIVVRGKRCDGHNEVSSSETNFTISVAKKQLALYPANQYRYYGEPNYSVKYFDVSTLTPTNRGANYEFGFKISDLVSEDQIKVQQSNIYTVNGQKWGYGYAKYDETGSKTATVCGALTDVDKKYEAPTFVTDAEKSSTVIDGGRGGYDLTMTGGSMSNYEFVYTDADGNPIKGTIYVYPRPVEITRFYAANVTSEGSDRSLYVHLTETAGSQFTRILEYYDDYTASAGTQFSGFSSPLKESVTPLSGNDIQPGYHGQELKRWYWFATQNGNGGTEGVVTPTEFSAQSGDKAKFFLSTDSIIGEDNIQIELTVTVEDTSAVTAKASTNVPIKVIAAKLTDAAKHAVNANYTLTMDDGAKNYHYAGRVDLRKIENIMIKGLPNKSLDSYTYGETLNLSGLWVMLYYEGTTNPVIVNYADFSQYGLYVNYYPYSSVMEEDKARADFVNYYRRARNGDHLSRAPIHETDVTGVDSPYEFKQDGMYLVVTAQRASGQAPVRKMIGSTIETEATQNLLGQKIEVKPLQLGYTFTASDKDYDGTAQAVGSMTLTGVYSGDLVYIRTGNNAYEGNWSWKDAQTGSSSSTASKARTALQEEVRGGYTFTSGWVKKTEGENSVLDFAGRSQWNSDTLTFEFVDPNVRYADENYPDTSTEALRDAALNHKVNGADYWTSKYTYNHDEWEFDAAPMPVNVSSIYLAGPDAANYTFGTTGTETRSISSVNYHTYSSGNSPLDGQDYVPYATINKAIRKSPDTAKYGLPKLELDDSTAVVRLLYDVSLDNLRAAAVRENRTRVSNGGAIKETDIADEYEELYDELHLEFAIEYFAPEAVSLEDVRYYCGNEHSYWDTFYFGGETVTDLYGNSSFYPELYRAEETEPGEYSGGELLGQKYKWTSEVNGKTVYKVTGEDGVETEYPLTQYIKWDKESGELIAQNGDWKLDDDFVFHVADKNMEPKSVKINGETYYYLYGYYTIVTNDGRDRVAIDRGAYVIGKVRLSETHNYMASAPLYTSEDYSGVPSAADTAAIAKAQTDLQKLVDETDRQAQAYIDYLKQVAEGKSGEETSTYAADMEDMLRMPKYRIDILSASDKQTALKSEDAPEEPMDVRLLRAVKFTDYREYTKQSELRAVLDEYENNYWSGYYWDDRYRNALEFSDDDPIVLGGSKPLELTVERDGVEYTETFNDGNTIPLYITFGSANNPIERWIKIHPESLTGRVGDVAVHLEVEFFPRRVARMDLKWESSDERVVTVDENGLMQFVGVGRAEITATSHYGRTSTIVVTVLPALPPEQQGVFNREKLTAYMGLDSSYFFYPDREMTRGEFVCVAAYFFIASDNWERFGSGEFIDIVGDEAYADAVKLLGEWGIVDGVGGNAFAGERIAAREEAAAIIARMLGIDPSKALNVGFSDTGVKDTWASGYIGGLYERGIVIGDGVSLFRPHDGVTRAEAAMMFYRVLNYKTPSVIYRYPADVPENHWAYSAVMRAINPGEPVLDDGTRRDESGQNKQ